jgi:hypothetical protein
MLSFSFYIPNGSDVRIHKDKVIDPSGMGNNPLENFKMEFTDVIKNVKSDVYNSEKSSFSIVYNQ